VRALLRAVGLLVGAAGAALVLRASRDAAARGETLADALIALPVTLRRDLDGVRGDARAALADGHRAADERRLELEAETRLP
jgi:hypothetical protein